MKSVRWPAVVLLLGVAALANADPAPAPPAAPVEPAVLPFGAGFEARQARRRQDLERPQRPQRPEHLERPERPERPAAGERQRGR